MATRSKLHAAVNEAVGVYGTSPTCHLSALARIPDYSIEQLDHAIEVERSLVRARTMRRSVYILGGDLLQVALAATRREVIQPYQTMSRKLGHDYASLARKVERCLSDGP